MAEMYAPCPCGSGAKFKFCCFQKRKTLDHETPEALIQRAMEFPVYRCWASPDWKDSGLATVCVVREMPNLQYVAAAYLVDVYCLGLKKTSWQTHIRPQELPNYKSMIGLDLEPIAYEDARSLILGGIAYARELGFEPNPRWEKSKPLVEPERPFVPKFEFGKDGKPFYIEGPHDDVASIMNTLNDKVRQGDAHFFRKLKEDEQLTYDLPLGDRGLENRIMDALQQRRAAEAIPLARQYVAKAPQNAYAHHLLGTALAMAKDFRPAIDSLETAAKLDPWPDTFFNLALAHRGALRLGEAVANFQRVLQLAGQEDDVARKAREELKRIDENLRRTSGISLEQSMANLATFELAVGSLRQGQLRAAIAGFQLVLLTEPNHVQSHGNLGLAHALLGERARALEHLNRALALDPSYEPAANHRKLVLGLLEGERLEVPMGEPVNYFQERVEARRRGEGPNPTPSSALGRGAG